MNGDTFAGSSTRHGTQTGWAKHQSLGEPCCDACRAAKAEYDARWRSSPERVRISRLSAKAQQLALKELKDRHPDEYRELYKAHKGSVFGSNEETQ